MADESVYAACAAPRPGVVPTHLGGQAVIEGVMMRGKGVWALSVRNPEGEIVTTHEPLARSSASHPWMGWPLVRGVVALVESLQLGMKALSRSAEIAGVDDESGEELPAGAMVGAMVVGVGLAVLIFIVLPALLTNLLVGAATENPPLWNAVDGVLRVFAFFLYVWAIGFMPDLKRVFAYHGAEHKVIHTVEHGEELTVANARRHSTMHVRCGTSFLLMVMVIAIVVFSAIPIKAIVASWGLESSAAVLALAIAIRLLLMPVVAGLAYEVTVKWAGPRADRPLVRALMWPGLQLQRMTTREPSDDMLEVAIASTEAVQAAEAAAQADRAPAPEPTPTPATDSNPTER